jgi:pimeloyl-ACP methyl ester carboxylesterase
MPTVLRYNSPELLSGEFLLRINMPQAAGMYYFSNGADDWSRPAVILLHSAGGNHLLWPPELRRIAGQRIYAPDLPGHGKSEGIGRQSIADYAGCVLDFMDDLKLRKAVFVGHSMGGAIALEIAIHHAQRTLGIAMINAGASLRLPAELLENTASPATLSLAIKTIGELAFGPQVDPRNKETVLQHMSTIRSSVLHSDFLACNSFDVTERLGRVKVPTLIVSATEDKMLAPHYSQSMHQKIKDSLLHTIDGAGHMVILENSLAVANILQFFLNRIDYQPGSRH